MANPTNYTLAATQANSTTTLATVGGTVEPWVFTIPAGGTLNLEAEFGFSTAASTTGITLAVLVSNPVGAANTVLGTYSATIPVTSATAASALQGGGVISVAPNASTAYSVTSTDASGTAFANFRSAIRNFSTNADVTVTLQFASEVGSSAVTLAAGSTAVGTIS